ncbi:hypothetical protein CF15_08255 [Pyrodictium occultum]|uniref:Uncharacterized protein n=1 Tax=Pyrodictium occultum TaxID=2309 RepID=A0A0V8RRV6_PYROC|nr:hypothetical protein CF15_08255 [Pyrodictium occultum]
MYLHASRTMSLAMDRPWRTRSFFLPSLLLYLMGTSAILPVVEATWAAISDSMLNPCISKPSSRSLLVRAAYMPLSTSLSLVPKRRLKSLVSSAFPTR